MAKEERVTRRAGRVVLKLYESLDPIIEQRTAEHGTTCREGCSHCCKLPASATVPEMAPVVSYLADRPTWKTVRPKLERLVSDYLESCSEFDLMDSASRAKFFRGVRKDCIFLRDDKCEIYPLRPSSCRFHYVASDPKHCSPDDPLGIVGQIDLVDVEDYVVLTGAMEIGEMAGGTIPAAFTMAARRLGIEFNIRSEDHLERNSYRMPVTEKLAGQAKDFRSQHRAAEHEKALVKLAAEGDEHV